MSHKRAPRKPHKHKAPRAKAKPKAASPKEVSPPPGSAGPTRKIPTRIRPVQTSGRFAGQPYQCTQADYAGRYGKPLVTIKRWWAKGYPLDDPDTMGEYLSPRGRKPGSRETDEEFEAPSRITPPADAFPDEAAPPAPADELPIDKIPVELDETFLTGKGVLAEIERLQKAGRERAAAYFAAIRTRANAQILANRFKEWLGIVEALRKLEKDAPEIRKLNDLSIDRDEADAAIGAVFAGFRAAANNLPGRAAAKLVGLTGDHTVIVEVLEREVEVLLRSLAEIALDAVAQKKAELSRLASEQSAEE